jgi:hypothetical protein
VDTQDRAFIQDIIQFTHMNHIVTVHTMQKSLAGSQAHEIAQLATGSIRSDELPQLDESSIVRVLRIVAAKIYAESIAALEDLGALGLAVQKRVEGGIFKQYLKYRSEHVKAFFDEILSDHNITLSALLNLLSITQLASYLQQDMLDVVKRSYEVVLQNLITAAQIYRTQGSQTKIAMAQGDPLASGWENDINIILDILPLDAPAKHDTGDVLVRGYNKIKHGFTVTENLASYNDSTATNNVVYGRFGLNAQILQQLIDNTIGVAGTFAELAALIHTLDQCGVSL